MTTKINPKKFIAGAVAIVALFAFPLVSGNPYYIHLVETIMIYAIVLFGLDIVVGYTGQVSLGHAGLFGIGAYTAGVLITLVIIAAYAAYTLNSVRRMREVQTTIIDNNRKAALQLIRIQNDLNALALAMRDGGQLTDEEIADVAYYIVKVAKTAP